MKIALVEDHSLIADLLARLCRDDLQSEVVLVESHGLRALPSILQLRPDLVLLDISLPDANGLDVAEAILRELPQTRILALSGRIDPVTLKRVRDLGIHGFIDKRVQNVQLLKEAIDLVSRRRQLFFSRRRRGGQLPAPRPQRLRSRPFRVRPEGSRPDRRSEDRR